MLALVLLLLVGLVTIAWGAGRPVGSTDPSGPGVPLAPVASAPASAPAPDPSPGSGTESEAPATPPATPAATPAARPPVERSLLPDGGRRVFAGNQFLVAYYGTAGTAALGVLGETEPDHMHRRLRRAAQPFAQPGRPVQVVYELIVTVADPYPGPDGDYSHDIDRASVQRYIDAAHRNGALLLLDLQPGRSDFRTVARRWAWALRDPWVGLAIDPEWRMGAGQVPARVIGSVSAAEINRTSAWLAALTRRHALPQKLFVVHQFRSAMVGRIERVRSRGRLAMVQHVDGFGTRSQKLATYDAVARPRQFLMGLKLFYDEDTRLMGAPQVHRIRPRVRFISYQ